MQVDKLSYLRSAEKLNDHILVSVLLPSRVLRIRSASNKVQGMAAEGTSGSFQQVLQ